MYYLLEKIGFDTAENEPANKLQHFTNLLILPPRLRAVRSSHDEGMHTPLPECRFSVKDICTCVLKVLITRVFVLAHWRSETIGSKFKEAKITVFLWPAINVTSAGGMMGS